MSDNAKLIGCAVVVIAVIVIMAKRAEKPEGTPAPTPSISVGASN